MLLLNQFAYLCVNTLLVNIHQSQQDLPLLEEGELEEQLKQALEADLQEIDTLASVEFKKRVLYDDLETKSKGTSHSGSVPGSEPLSRKEFMFEGLKHSATSSVQGSKASLSSASSLPKGSKASLISTTPPKGSKASLISNTPPKGSRSNLASDTPSKGSKSSLTCISTTPPNGSQSNLVSDTPPRPSAAKVDLAPKTHPQETNTSFSSSLLGQPLPRKEENDSQEPVTSQANTNVSTALLSEI